MAEYVRTIHTANGAEVLTDVSLMTATDWTADPTNYWTIELRVRASGEQYGRTLGSTYTLATRSLTAGVPVALWASQAGSRLEDAESLLAVVTSVGTPTALGDPVLLIDVSRIVR